MSKCTACSNDDELRPYGAGGAMICFPCSDATAESRLIRDQEFTRQLDAAAAVSGVIVVGEPTGPRPMSGKTQ